MGRMQIDLLIRRAQDALSRNRFTQAKAICEQVLAADPKHPTALLISGQVQFAMGFYDDSEKLLRRVIALKPRDPRAHLVLGELHTVQGRFDESVARYDRVLKIVPGNAIAVAGKSDALEKSGQRDKAAELLKPFFDGGTETAEMALMQCRLYVSAKNYDAVEPLVEKHVANPATINNTKQNLLSMLGRAHERAGRYEEAFEAYRRFNDSVTVPENNEQLEQMVVELKSTFTAERMAKLPRATHGSQLPVFIMGMPRSGSTLVETILEAHPDVSGAGEFTAMHEIVNDLPLIISSSLGFPPCAADLDQDDVDTIGGMYLEKLRAVHPTATRITDKYLANYRHLGLIELCLPECHVIHTVRHPLDTCISCYSQTLFASAHPYSFDLRRLGATYVEYEKIMAHWREVLKVPFLEVKYEDVVADQEKATREILDFIGLDFDESCLRFYDTGRVVQTASYDQINRPIYNSSIGRWRHFEHHLGPLKEELAKGGWTEETLQSWP